MVAGCGGKPRTRAQTSSPSVNFTLEGGLADEGGGNVSFGFLSDLFVVLAVAVESAGGCASSVCFLK